MIGSNKYIGPVLALIGLVADCLGIYVFFFSGAKIDDPNLSNKIVYESLFLIILFYSWFTLSWYLTTKNMNAYEIIGKGSFKKAAIFSTSFIGLLCLPLSLLISFFLNNYLFCFIHLILCAPILALIYLLGNITSLNMKIDKFGRWKCSIAYVNPLSNERFDVGNVIKVYKKSNKEEEFFYNSEQGPNKPIQKSDLDFYFFKISSQSDW